MKQTKLKAWEAIQPRLGTIRHKVLKWLTENPKSTIKDACVYLGEYSTISARFTELEFQGLIKADGVVNGRSLYVVVTDQEEALRINKQNAYKKALENSPEARLLRAFSECKKRDSLPTAVVMAMEANRDFITPKP